VKRSGTAPLALLVVGLTAQISFGQESTTKEPPPAAQTQPATLGPGDHTRSLMIGELKRTYLVHVPQGYDPKLPTPIVLALHGALMSGPAMVPFSGLNKKSDEAGFIAVYPSGTGTSPFLFWNAGGMQGKSTTSRPDDVAFIGKLLDDLATVVNVDEKRVYACGMSNGAMMCYRLAAELSERIAAIGPVAGTIAVEESQPKRPVPVIHFHGTKDTFIPFGAVPDKAMRYVRFKSLDDSIRTWVKLNGCETEPKIETLSKDGDAMKVIRKTYAGGKAGSEVVLIVIEEGGHTWPGQQPPVGFIGKSVKTVSANDLLWEFFRKHPLP